MDLKIINGDYEVINSGTVVGNQDTPIEFNIQTLSFIFEFRNDVKVTTQRIDKILINKKSLRLVLTNFNNPLGYRNIKPIPIGTIAHRKLYLNFSVYSISDSAGKIFHYSFLLEKEA
jgi:hypothetical protein